MIAAYEHVTTAQIDRELAHMFGGRRKAQGAWAKRGDLCVGLLIGGLLSAVLLVLWPLVGVAHAAMWTGALTCAVVAVMKDEPMDAVRPVWRVLKWRIW